MTDDRRIHWADTVPFILMHVCALPALACRPSGFTLSVAVTSYLVRMWAITAGYHRYFAHRAYRTSRVGQFVLGLLGTLAAQKGPLWWAAWHRHHHRHSDRSPDVHSPVREGFWYSHVGWIVTREHVHTPLEHVPDLATWPELHWLNRWHAVPATLYGLGFLALGLWAGKHHPEWHTSAGQMATWGYFVSTACLYHATFSINSVGHLLGSRPYPTPDNSRNNWVLAVLTLGEGWHNNHHRRPGRARQGIHWWQFDPTYRILCVLGGLGLVWDLQRSGSFPPPGGKLTVPLPGGSLWGEPQFPSGQSRQAL